jgi:hypothetical protein
MRNKLLAGFGLVVMGTCAALPAAAEDWRACVVGACLKGVCGDNDASVVVSMGTDVDDPAIGGADRLQAALLGVLARRNVPITGQPLLNCSPSQPDQGAADQIAQNIFAQMSTSFSDVTMVSANDIVFGYDSVPGSQDPDYNGGASATDDGGAQAQQQAQEQAQQQAQQQAQAEEQAQEQAAAEQREQEVAAAAEREREREAFAQQQQELAAAAEREREREAAAQRERERAAAELAQQRQLEAQNSQTDAKECVSAPVLQSNATFEGNTGASVVNGCGRPVDVRICLMTESRGWNCGMSNGLAPQASWSWSSFHATGQVFMDARINGSGKQLASP